MKTGKNLIMDVRNCAAQAVIAHLGRAALLAVTAIPTAAVVFIIFFIAKEALPFFENLANVREFFTSANWAPSRDTDPHFGALSIFYGTLMVTVGSCAVAVPLGVLAAVCLTEIVGRKTAQFFKPIVELLAAVPSVAYGFFAIVVFAPILQNHGGALIASAVFFAGAPVAAIVALPLVDVLFGRFIKNGRLRRAVEISLSAAAACQADSWRDRANQAMTKPRQQAVMASTYSTMFSD